MRRFVPLATLPATIALAFAGHPAAAAGDDDSHKPGLDAIQTIVVIYAENRSFDNLFGHFPAADGLRSPAAKAIRQVDRDGTVLPVLPPA